MSFDRVGRMGFAWPLGAALALLPALAPAEDAQDAALQLEVRYIDALSKSGYADFTEQVIADAQKRWPDAGGVLKAAQIRAQLSGGKQAEVEKEIAARPDQNSLDTWLLKLELAQSYYAYSKFTEADKLYADFFKRFTKVPAAAKESYVNAALLYIQMLGKIGRAKDALPFYKLAMEQAPTDEVRYFVRADYLKALLAQAEALQGAEREKLLKDADALANQMVWRQDGYFGDAINGLAHVKMLRGDTKGAQEMINDYLDTLMTIHEEYKRMDPDGAKGVLRQSPLPQCRYLIGSMLLREAQAEIAKPTPNEETIKNLLLGERDPETKKRNGQGALNHLVNVYVNYPESQSAASAGEMASEITRIILARYNTAVKFNTTPEQDAKVRQAQFVEADVKFDSGDWPGAAAAFCKTISRYGLNAEALPRLQKLVEATVRAGVKGNALDPMAALDAETVMLTVAEGFSGVADENLRTEAGNTLGKIADFFSESGLRTLQDKTNAAFFRYYPKHPGAVSRQVRIAEEKAKAGDADGAIQLYEQIAEAATAASQRDTRTKALSELVKIYAPNGVKPDPEAELRAAQAFADHFADIERPGINGALAQFALAGAYQHRADSMRRLKDEDSLRSVRGDYAQAAKLYTALGAALAKEDNIYAATRAERDQLEKAGIAQAALFQRALCLQRIPATGNDKADAALKKSAQASYEAYLKRFPKGSFAPTALLQIATIQVAAGDVEGSQATLTRLAKDFPDSDQAKNAIPMQAASLLSMGMRGAAVQAYKDMFKAGGTYTPAQYMDAAKALLDEGEADLAIEGCDSVLKGSVKGYYPQAMLLRARALLVAGRPEDAYKQVEELKEKYGRTTVAIDTQLLLVDVAGEMILVAKDQDARNALISEVKDAVGFVTAQRKDPGTAARLNLAVAEVARKGYEAAQKGGADTATLAQAAGSALNAYRVAMSAGAVAPNDPAVARYIEDAYLGYISLAQIRAELAETPEEAAGFYGDIVEFGEEYLSDACFPQGKYRTEILTAVNQARNRARK